MPLKSEGNSHTPWLSIEKAADVNLKLEQQELVLLNTLLDILPNGTELERDMLRVKVASRGIELGRAYFRLFERGFVVERFQNPGLLGRVFGARQKCLVRLSDTARAFASTNLATQGEVPEVFKEVLDPGLYAEPSTGLVRPPAKVVETRFIGEVTEARAKSRRLTSSDYTEELGGAPLESASPGAETELVQSLGELLALLGFELTPAGRLLAETRSRANTSEAEIALEILVTSFAHAARLASTGTVRIVERMALAHIAAIENAFAHFVVEGVLDQAVLGSASASMADFISRPSTSPALDDYLADAMRGLAPPAVCPDDMFELINVDDQ